MINVLLITFSMSLIYMSIANRMYSYILILFFQGMLLFGVSFLELTEISVLNLVFILVEAVVFKAIAVPLFLNYVIKRNKITREVEPYLPNFISLIIVTGIIVTTFIIANAIDDPHLNKTYFVVALSTLFSGLYLIISRKKIITHIVGFLIIENGVFILALAVGNEMPMLVNTSILLDFFVSVLVFGIFVNKIGDVFKEHDVHVLSQLRD
jgi:hydrogenase-4 component E